jgi:hypothetical protein
MGKFNLFYIIKIILFKLNIKLINLGIVNQDSIYIKGEFDDQRILRLI